MPYGTVNAETRQLIERRAAQSNITMTEVDLESEAENAVLLSIIVGGTLDEDFQIGYLYAANTVDWIAEYMPEQCGKEFWEISLSDDDGNLLYYVAGGGE